MPEAFDFCFLAFVLHDIAIRFGAGIEYPNLALALPWPGDCQSAARDIEAADHDGGTIGFSPNPMGQGLRADDSVPMGGTLAVGLVFVDGLRAG
ncbi:hypothetical protein [Pseudomonas aeruginosa]|uniref:hypothetical protein n=1 Tax=Pseudomonas aeruginosa TaxID=287 RepID=UPI000AFF1E16|nr:hypothetical protein [Pseudomonas aeruginosa]MBO3773049.1 hypothetical protein [Pseudomonas aeruginosa]MBX5683698.1 hypothetical protein [Pseudomonas aeruginosa]MBX5786849.1 hypothetical protein [Pseudomonas aeruginosa]MCD2809356.1 hypothetical protein [Pseudomonas aeruginosa]MCH0749122.1 hypothetical protein [Pseudomonas aeruginosa]